jgi:hypothetical protein
VCTSGVRDFHTLNVKVGFCTCWDCDYNGVCAHLLAAEQHPQIGALCSFELQLPADPAARVFFERRQPLPLAEGVVDPLDAIGDAALGELVKQLAAAAPGAGSIDKQQQQPQQQLSEPKKAWLRRTSQLTAAVKHMSGEQVLQHLPALDCVAETTAAYRPAFTVLASTGKQSSRQDTDRVHKALFPGRSRNRPRPADAPLLPAAAAEPQVPGGELLGLAAADTQQGAKRGRKRQEEAAQTAKYAKTAEAGRKRQKHRSQKTELGDTVGNYVRSSKQGYLRPIRRGNKEQGASKQ